MTLVMPRTARDADPVLGPLLEHFLACLCHTLGESGRGVCSAECGCSACCLVPGDSAPAADRCDCVCEDGSGQGQAWVRWVRDQPYQASGASRNRRECQSFRTLKVLEAGVYRCITSAGEDGQPPSCEARGDDARGLLMDRRLLHKAVACCPVFKGRQLDLLSLEPTAVKGGCAGVVIQFSVDV